ncbi:hypothetical protein ECHLIB_0849 [Ehrlichia chaffeensis str. Liberty]|uniref:hypothetical protein n=1 Tax=Ehrlichia chaffeensis TaxID=945 RepID=UPI000444B395|nr:hypothetical protein [Ehrlichia chaffeensis]AHX06893.1 hypothetical protein ECHLIB_0849 [Ehrlichia chaffeensis str. Liberty]
MRSITDPRIVVQQEADQQQEVQQQADQQQEVQQQEVQQQADQQQEVQQQEVQQQADQQQEVQQQADQQQEVQQQADQQQEVQQQAALLQQALQQEEMLRQQAERQEVILQQQEAEQQQGGSPVPGGRPSTVFSRHAKNLKRAILNQCLMLVTDLYLILFVPVIVVGIVIMMLRQFMMIFNETFILPWALSCNYARNTNQEPLLEEPEYDDISVYGDSDVIFPSPSVRNPFRRLSDSARNHLQYVSKKLSAAALCFVIIMLSPIFIGILACTMVYRLITILINTVAFLFAKCCSCIADAYNSRQQQQYIPVPQEETCDSTSHGEECSSSDTYATPSEGHSSGSQEATTSPHPTEQPEPLSTLITQHGPVESLILNAAEIAHSRRIIYP